MKRNHILFLVILFLAALLRIFHLSTDSFCIDEGLTFDTLSQPSMRQVLSCVVANKDVPPLYFILMRFWFLLGEGEFIMRLFSAVFSILAIYAIYKLGTILFGENVGLFSAFLLAIAPLHIYYSQIARMYGLAIFLTFMALYFSVRLLHKADFISWLGWFLFTLFAVYAHYFAFFIIFTGTIFIIIYRKEYAYLYKGWFLGIAIIFLLYMFWASVLFKSVKGIYFFESAKPLFLRLVELPKVFYALSVGFTTFDTTNYSTVAKDIILYLWLILPTVFAFGYLISLALLRSKNSPKPIVWLSLTFFIPILITYVVNFFLNSRLFDPRYFLIFSCAYYILAAKGVTYIKKPVIKISILALITVLCAYSSYNYYFNKKFIRSEDWRSASQYIKSNSQTNDFVLTCFSSSGEDPLYYYKVNLDKKNVYNFVNPLTASEEDLNNAMTKMVQGYRRVWLCRDGHVSWDPNDRVLGWLKKRYATSKLIQFYKIDFYLFSE